MELSKAKSYLQNIKLNLQNKMVIAFSAIIFCVMIISSFVAASMVGNRIENLAKERIESILNIVTRFKSDYENKAQSAAAIIAQQNDLRAAVWQRDQLKVAVLIGGIQQNAGPYTNLSFIEVRDDKGRVLSGKYENNSQTLSVDTALADVLTKNSLKASGTIVMAGTGVTDSGIVVQAVAPILPNPDTLMDGQSRTKPFGVVLVGYLLNDGFVDDLKDKTTAEVSLYKGNDGVATTFIDENEERIKQMISPDIMSRLADEDSVFGQMEVAGDDYDMGYIPVINATDGKTIGAMSVGLSRKSINEARNATRGTLFLIMIVGVLATSGAGYFIALRITKPIKRFMEVAKDIAAGRLEQRVEANTGDEIEELAEVFNQMAVSLKAMREQDKFSNPLTNLPGNVPTENEINRVLDAKQALAVLYLDLDNFKAFNDKYGFKHGDKVLQMTAELLADIIKEIGNKTDFLGHIGGDDYVVVTTPDKVETICPEIIKRFDEEIIKLYSEDDRARGYIMTTDRHGRVVSYPITSMSIAVVTNEGKEISSYLELGELAAEVKKYAKSIEGSVYITDKNIL